MKDKVKYNETIYVAYDTNYLKKYNKGFNKMSDKQIVKWFNKHSKCLEKGKPLNINDFIEGD